MAAEPSSRIDAPAAAPWPALLAGTVAVLVAYLAGRTLFERAGGWLAAHGVSPGLASIVPLPVYVGLVLAGVAVATRLAGLDADPRPALRLARRVRRPALAGLLAGAALVAAADAVAVAGGWAALGPASPTAHLATGLAGYAILYAGIAYSEEVVFRGALLGLLARGAGVWPAVAATSALFALVHVAVSVTPGRLIGLFLLGVLLALLRLRAGSLWPAIAAHWSFHVLSFAAVLGLPPLRLTLTGPVAVVGTADQLDAGLLMILALALAVATAPLWFRHGETAAAAR